MQLNFNTQPEIMTFQDFKKSLFNLHNSDFFTYNSLLQTYNNSRDSFTVELNTLTVAEIKKMLNYTYSTKKADLIKELVNGLGDFFFLGKPVSYMLYGGDPKGERQAAEKKVLESITEVDFIKWAEDKKAAIEARKKTYTNPETLEEFKSFIYVFGIGKLSPDQLKRYDELTGAAHHEKKEQEAVKRVQSVDNDFILHETKHTQKGHDLFVCSLTERVDSETFKSLSSRAKLFGGYYSSYNKGGAIAGFTFTDKSSADKFIDGGSNQQEVDKKTEYKQQTRAEILKEKAEKLILDGEEELSRDRLANTHRRATQAASAENRAANQIAFGKTLLNIAEGLEAGTINHLHKLTNITELETLKQVLSAAKWAHIRELKQKSDEYEISENTVSFVKMPFPLIYASNVLSFLHTAKTISGRKLAAARILKKLGKSESLEINHWQLIEDYETVFCAPYSVSWDKYNVDRYKEMLAPFKRLKRLDLDTLPVLRAALRELLNLTATKTQEQERTEKLKQLERSFIGKKIDGFFPTPETLAARLVEEAEIEEGNTILEPSAGLGHIAEQITAAHPNNHLTVIEQFNSLAEVLEVKGFNTINGDFLEHTEKYDRIIMNPPFENLQDIDHVLHAFDLLKAGGRLVAVMAGNKDGERQKIKGFRSFVEKNGYCYKNEDGAFLSSFRSTGVNTITVILNKQIA